MSFLSGDIVGKAWFSSTDWETKTPTICDFLEVLLNVYRAFEAKHQFPQSQPHSMTAHTIQSMLYCFGIEAAHLTNLEILSLCLDEEKIACELSKFKVYFLLGKWDIWFIVK